MKTHRFSLLLLLLLGLFCLISISGSASSSSSVVSKESLGIPPQDATYFKSEIIKCKDGSKRFTKSQLNDDFCDCPDGTDEPGTSACPNGKFYCRNTGHVPLSLFSSRVNDGICDCCDGSDEYDGKVKCANTCWEAGKVARDKLNKKITTYQRGVIIRKQEVEQAKQAISKEEAELSKLKSEEKILKGLVQQLREQKEQIEKAEEKERLEKEKEEKRKNESKEEDIVHEKDSTETEHEENHESIGVSDEPASEQDSTETEHEENHESIGILDEPASEQDAAVVNDEVVEAENDDNVGKDAPHTHAVEQHAADDKNTIDTENGHDAESSAISDQVEKQEKDESESTEGLSKEELGRLVASRWTGENSGQQNEKDNEAKEEHKGNTETQDSAHDADYEGYSSEEDKYKYDEDAAEADVDEDFEEDDNDDADNSYKPDSEDEIDFPDITTSSSPSWLEKIQLTVRNILQAVNLFQTPVDKSDAARIRKEYDDASSKLSKIQSRISNLDEKLKHDFGPEKEFYSSYDRCFENKQNKYVYKVCPFKKASQVEGHSTTQLGHWEKFEDSYRTMLFSNGDKCWNGPDRSLKVKLRCGLDNEITDVDEPSRCEYVAVLSTPALCLEEKLKELQHKLELMNKEQPQSHDEL